MANKYEKLDQFLDEAFKGSPNTLEANETKIEIITNLRQMYDELIGSGLSEDEALEKTCDSLGDPAEIFGGTVGGSGVSTAAVGSTGRGGSEIPYTPTTPLPVLPPKPPASPFRPLVITLGVLLCALCWLPAAICGVNGIVEGWVAAPVIGMPALGVLCFIYAGCMRVGVSAKTKLHYFFIGLGVACEVGCAVPVVVFTANEALGVSLLLSLVAAGVVLIVLGAMIPTDKWDPSKRHSEPKSPLERSIWLITLALYLLLSFATQAWAVTWLVWLIGAAVRSLVAAISDYKGGTTL